MYMDTPVGMYVSVHVCICVCVLLPPCQGEIERCPACRPTSVRVLAGQKLLHVRDCMFGLHSFPACNVV